MRFFAIQVWNKQSPSSRGGLLSIQIPICIPSRIVWTPNITQSDICAVSDPPTSNAQPMNSTIHSAGLPLSADRLPECRVDQNAEHRSYKKTMLTSRTKLASTSHGLSRQRAVPVCTIPTPWTNPIFRHQRSPDRLHTAGKHQKIPQVNHNLVVFLYIDA